MPSASRQGQQVYEFLINSLDLDLFSGCHNNALNVSLNANINTLHKMNTSDLKFGL